MYSEITSELLDLHRRNVKKIMGTNGHPMAFNYLRDQGLLADYPDLVEELIVPLLAKNRADAFHKVIKPYPNIEKKLLKVLDDFKGSEEYMKDYATNHGLKPKEMDMLSGKPLSNTIKKLLIRYGYNDLKIVPNYHAKTAISTIYHAYLERSETGSKIMHQRVRFALKEHPESKSEFFGFLFKIKDYNEMTYFLRKLDKEFDGNNAQYRSIPCPHFGTQKYFKLDIPLQNVIFINKEKYFKEFFDLLKKDEHVTGFDSEFNFRINEVQESISIIQIAIKNMVYILDMNFLSKKKSLATDFVKYYFLNKKITILGCGLTSDFKILKSSNILQSTDEIKATVVDVITIKEGMKLLNVNLPPSKEKGLSGIVESLFKLPLEKRQRFSVWNNRPLSRKQLTYAALDARICLRVFDKMRQFCIDSKMSKKNLEKIFSTYHPKPLEIGQSSGKTGENWISEIKEHHKTVICLKLPKILRMLRIIGINTLSSSKSYIKNHIKTDKNSVVLTKNEHSNEIKRLSANCIVIDDYKYVEAREYFLRCKEELRPPSRCFHCNSTNILTSEKSTLYKEEYHSRGIIRINGDSLLLVSDEEIDKTLGVRDSRRPKKTEICYVCRHCSQVFDWSNFQLF